MTGYPCRSEYGLIWNAIESVFSLVNEKLRRFDRNDDLREEFYIQCAYLESKINVNLSIIFEICLVSVYNEELHDLLLPRSTVKSHSHLSRLELRENPRTSGVQITNLTWKNVFSIDQCLKYKRQGDLSRTMGSTQMNRDSSRSHTMFSLAIRCRQRNQTKFIRQGKLNFVDLGKCLNMRFHIKVTMKIVSGQRTSIKNGSQWTTIARISEDQSLSICIEQSYFIVGTDKYNSYSISRLEINSSTPR